MNRVRIEILTNKGKMGFDDSFEKKVNIVCSDDNTSGKSSVISAIYYGLGLEEIMGGKGYNVLSSAFKSKIEFEEEELDVLESRIFLEVTNGVKNITIFRVGKNNNRNASLVTVYDSKIEQIHNAETSKEDMYVHYPNSAENKKGFHKFLEDFIGLSLPYVPSTDDKERKLYLQLIFSCMFIEQKRGWADLFSGMPHFGIKESSKRVIEFILNMDTLKNEKLKQNLRYQQKNLTSKWKDLYSSYQGKLELYNLKVEGIDNKIQVLDEKESIIKIVYRKDEKRYSLENYIIELKNELTGLNKAERKNIKGFDLLKNELEQIERDILTIEDAVKNGNLELQKEKTSIEGLKSSLRLIEKDIINNQDAQRIRNLGSKEDFKVFKDVCPTCEQNISDTVLISQNVNTVMSIDENIKHLKSQKELFEFAIKQKELNMFKIGEQNKIFNNKHNTLYLLAAATRNDLYALDGSYSESTVYKKVELQRKISDLENIEDITKNIDNEFLVIANEWKEYLIKLSTLPEKKLTQLDEQKLKTLRQYFIKNLEEFGYRSSLDINKVQISNDTYMPTIENFDMKFDSSASDHIRRIWAFTIALLQTSNEYSGNHPGILIFDEPGQHSIIVGDMKAFFNNLNSLKDDNQVIVGITIKETETKDLVLKEIEAGSKGIHLKDRAFKMSSE